MTVSWFVRRGKILLGLKKLRLGAGLYNGFGGQVEPGEAIDQAAIREFKEETRGMRVLRQEEIGRVTVRFQESDLVVKLHFFLVTKGCGEPAENEEMKPEWFSLGKIPYDRMWPTDRICLPLAIKGLKFTGHFLLDNPEQRRLVSQTTNVIGGFKANE